jgi:hypothetical protein
MMVRSVQTVAVDAGRICPWLPTKGLCSVCGGILLGVRRSEVDECESGALPIV